MTREAVGQTKHPGWKSESGFLQVVHHDAKCLICMKFCWSYGRKSEEIRENDEWPAVFERSLKASEQSEADMHQSRTNQMKRAFFLFILLLGVTPVLREQSPHTVTDRCSESIRDQDVLCSCYEQTQRTSQILSRQVVLVFLPWRARTLYIDTTAVFAFESILRFSQSPRT